MTGNKARQRDTKSGRKSRAETRNVGKRRAALQWRSDKAANRRARTQQLVLPLVERRSLTSKWTRGVRSVGFQTVPQSPCLPDDSEIGWACISPLRRWKKDTGGRTETTLLAARRCAYKTDDNADASFLDVVAQPVPSFHPSQRALLCLSSFFLGMPGKGRELEMTDAGTGS